MRTVGVLGLVAASALLIAVPLVAVAQETTTTVAQATTTVSIPEPAIKATPPPVPPSSPAWTTRYLVPTGIILGLLAVLGTVVQYFVRVVQARYKRVR